MTIIIIIITGETLSVIFQSKSRCLPIVGNTLDFSSIDRKLLAGLNKPLWVHISCMEQIKTVYLVRSGRHDFLFCFLHLCTRPAACQLSLPEPPEFSREGCWNLSLPLIGWSVALPVSTWLSFFYGPYTDKSPPSWAHKPREAVCSGQFAAFVHGCLRIFRATAVVSMQITTCYTCVNMNGMILDEGSPTQGTRGLSLCCKELNVTI